MTAEQVRALVAAEQEVGCEAVLAVLKKEHGKAISVRLLDKLPGGRAEWDLDTRDGYHLTSRLYYRSSSREGVRLTLTPLFGGNKILDAVWVEEHNACYFGNLRERNRKRVEVMNDIKKCQRMADALNGAQVAFDAFRAAFDNVRALTCYIDGPFSPDGGDLIALLGADCAIAGRSW